MQKPFSRLLVERYLLKELQDQSRIALVIPKLPEINSCTARYKISNELVNLNLLADSKADANYWQTLEAAISDSLAYSSFIPFRTIKYQLEGKALETIILADEDFISEDRLVFAEFIRKGGLIYENLEIYIEVIYDLNTKFQTNIRQCSCGKASCAHRKIAKMYVANRHLVPFITATYVAS